MSKTSSRDVASDQMSASDDPSSAWTNRRATEQATRAATARQKAADAVSSTPRRVNENTLMRKWNS